MTTATYDLQSLLNSADASAGAGDWATAQQHLAQARILAPHDAGVATGLGISLLRLGRLPDALNEFQVAVQLAPNNAETYNNLGFACALNGQADAAETAFLNALEQDPENGAATRNLAQLYLDLDRLQEGVALLVSRVRSAPDDADALHLLGTCYEEVEDLESARALFRQAVALRPTEVEFQTALARVAPAQPEAVLARPGLSDKLARLKASARPATAASAPTAAPRSPAPAHAPAVAFYGTGEFSDATRLSVPANALADQRHRVKLTRTPDTDDLNQFDVIVFSRPHLSAELLHTFKRAQAVGKKIVVDMVCDDFALPTDHPRRSYLASREALTNLELVLGQADLVTTASAHLAAALAARCRRVAVAPSAWSPANVWWNRAAPAHAGTVLGWVGDPSQDLDLVGIHDAICAVIKSRPDVHLAIAGSPTAYQLFDDVPEPRKLFLPMVGPDDFPYLLAHFDVLMAPVRHEAWACVGSDQRLMEAGARGLPFAASPAPALGEWAEGGVFCASSDEWTTQLNRLVDENAWRAELAKAGHGLAQSRRAEIVGAFWHELIGDLARAR